MKKGNKIYILTIILLLVVIVVLCILLAKGGDSKTEIKYTDYTDQLIKIKETKGIHSVANIIDEDSLGVLVSSDTQGTRTVLAEVIFYDDQNKKVSSDASSSIMLNDGMLFFVFNLPNLTEGEYAGTIDLKLTEGEEETFDRLADVSKITYQETHSVNDLKSTVFNITGVNGNDYNIASLFTNVVVMKNDKIVAYNSFSLENILAGATFNSIVELPPVSSGNELQSVDFDKVYIFTTDAHSQD